LILLLRWVGQMGRIGRIGPKDPARQRSYLSDGSYRSYWLARLIPAARWIAATMEFGEARPRPAMS